MDALFETILSMSLSAGFLVAMIVGIRLCFRRVPKWVHCCLWALVAVRLMIPSLPQSNLSMVPERVSDSEAVVQMVAEMPRFAPVPRPAPTEAPAPVEVPEAPAAPEVEMPVNEAPAPIDYMVLFARVWLAGAVVMGLYAVSSYLRVRRRVAASVSIGGRVYLCDYIDTPFLLGFFRPRIYLPSYLDDTTAQHVLSHERAHLARRDHWWKPLGFVLLSLHWFNPMIWLGYILLCRDIEMACDEAVIRTMCPAQKKGYSTALLKCSMPRRIVSICPLAFGEVSVKERIQSVLNYKKPALWLTVIGLTALILGAVFFLTNPVEEVTEKEVDYYPTAIYHEDLDWLTLYEYDDEFRVSKMTQYRDGKETERIDYTYEEKGGTLIETAQITKLYYSYSPDGYKAYEQTSEEVTHKKLDQDGNVLQEEVYRGGELAISVQYTYDEQGNPILEQYTNATTSSETVKTYDEAGNLIEATKQWAAEKDGIIPHSRRTIWTYDAHGNALTEEWTENGILLQRYENTYDENDRMVAQKVYREDKTEQELLFTYSPDGTVKTISSSQPVDSIRSNEEIYDKFGNLLVSTYTENGRTYSICRNYIGTDGSISIGVPKDIYSEGVVSSKLRYTPQTLTYNEEGGVYTFKQELDFVETDLARFWFDDSVDDSRRIECIEITEKILGAMGSQKIDVYILSGTDYGATHVSGNALYTTNRKFRTREYAADVILASCGQFSHYGLAYGYANVLCQELNIQQREALTVTAPSAADTGDLNVLCFDPSITLGSNIRTARALACGFVDQCLASMGEESFLTLLRNSNTSAGMKEIADRLEIYYQSFGFTYRPTELRFGYGGKSLDYIVDSDLATFYLNRDWKDLWQFNGYPVEDFLHQNYPEIKEFFLTTMAQMAKAQEYLDLNIPGTQITLTNHSTYDGYYNASKTNNQILSCRGVAFMDDYAYFLRQFTNLNHEVPENQWKVNGFHKYLSIGEYGEYRITYSTHVWNTDPEETPENRFIKQYRESIGRPIDASDYGTVMDIECAYFKYLDPNLTTPASYSFVHYLASLYGADALKEIILNDAPLPKPYEELVADWTAYLEDNYSEYGTYRP